MTKHRTPVACWLLFGGAVAVCVFLVFVLRLLESARTGMVFSDHGSSMERFGIVSVRHLAHAPNPTRPALHGCPCCPPYCFVLQLASIACAVHFSQEPLRNPSPVYAYDVLICFQEWHFTFILPRRNLCKRMGRNGKHGMLIACASAWNNCETLPNHVGGDASDMKL